MLRPSPCRWQAIVCVFLIGLAGCGRKTTTATVAPEEPGAPTKPAASAEAGDEAVDKWIKRLRGSKKARERAAVALGRMGPKAKSALPALKAALVDGNDDDTRRVLLTAIARMLPEVKEALPIVLQHVDERSLWEGEVREAILSMKADAVPHLVKELPQKHAFELLGDLGADAKEAVPALVKIARKPPTGSVGGRGHAVAALRQIGPAAKEAVPVLTELLQDDGSKVSEKQREWWNHERLEIAVALNHIDPKNAAAIAYLKQAEANGNPKAKVQATFELARVHPDDADAVRRLAGYAKTFPTEATLVVQDLGELGARSREFFPQVKEYMEKPGRDSYARTHTFEAAVKIDPVLAVPPLVALLKDQNRDVRRGAIWALGFAGANAKSALPTLRDMAKGDLDNDKEDFFARLERDTIGHAIHKIEGTKPPPYKRPTPLVFEPITVEPGQAFRLDMLKDGRQFDGMDAAIAGAAVTADQRWVVAWGEDDDGFLNFHVWDIPSGKTLYSVTINHVQTGYVMGLRGQELLTRGPQPEEGEAVVLPFDLKTGKAGTPLTLADSRDFGPYLFASSEGRYFVGVEPGKARIWDGKTGKVIRRYGSTEDGQGTLGIGGGTPTVTFDATFTMAVVASPNGLAVLPLDPKREPLAVTSRGDGFFGAAVSPDGKRIAGGSFDFPLRVFEIQGEELKLLRTYGTKTVAGTHVSFSADGRLVSTSGGQMVRIWDVESGAIVHRLDDARWSHDPTAFFVPGTDWFLLVRENSILLRPMPRAAK